MSSTVIVLAPNGRRQNVKVTPNTTVLQIIEEVCLKQKFDSNKYDLKHGRSLVDVTSTFRFSGIPNNAKLELAEREKPRTLTTEVTVALQLESGERRQCSVSSDTTFYDLVVSIQKTDEDLFSTGTDRVPVIIYMREEIIGTKALRHATLKSVGLLSGRAVVRLVSREVEPSVLLKISEQIEQEQKKVEKYSAKLELDTLPNNTVVTESKNRHEELMDTSTPVASTSVIHDSKQPADIVQSSMLTSQHATSSAELSSGLQSSSSNVSPHHKANDVHPVTPSTSYARSETAVPKTARPKATQLMPEFKFPEETAGQDLYRNELSNEPTLDYQSCDRKAIVFNIEESLPATSSEQLEEPADEFFEVTKDDLQKMIKHLRQQIYQEENAPLMTSSMRQARLESSVAKYQYAIIRFIFPDKLVLQARFRPRETVHSLNKFVKSHLKDKNASFYLYCTPPQQVLTDVAMTLIEAHLVPMASVHVGFQQPSSDGYLCDETAKLKKSRINADEIVRSSLPSSSCSGGSTDTAPISGVYHKQGLPERHTVSEHPAPSRPSHPSSHGPVPKWYKPAGK